LAAFSYARFPEENSTVGEDVEKLKQRQPLLACEDIRRLRD